MRERRAFNVKWAKAAKREQSSLHSDIRFYHTKHSTAHNTKATCDVVPMRAEGSKKITADKTEKGQRERHALNLIVHQQMKNQSLHCTRNQNIEIKRRESKADEE